MGSEIAGHTLQRPGPVARGEPAVNSHAERTARLIYTIIVLSAICCWSTDKWENSMLEWQKERAALK